MWRLWRQTRASRLYESEIWQRLDAALRDPSIIEREIERQRIDGPEQALSQDRDAAQRQFTKLEKQQERLIRRLRDADDDGFPWELVEREIRQLEDEKQRAHQLVREADRKLAMVAATNAQLQQLQAYCERVAENLDHFGFDEKRLALDALNITVHANGRDWWLEGSVPMNDDVQALRPIHQYIVATCGRDFEPTLHMLLAANVAKVDAGQRFDVVDAVG